MYVQKANLDIKYISKSNPQFLLPTPVGSNTQVRKIYKAVMSDLLLLDHTQQDCVAAKKDIEAGTTGSAIAPLRPHIPSSPSLRKSSITGQLQMEHINTYNCAIVKLRLVLC